MTEVFKERVAEAPQEPEIAPQGPKPLPSDKLAGNEKKATDELTQEEKKLDIWEGLNRKKFVVDFFKVGEFADEFNLKMQTATIDKYIRNELENRKYEKNIDNWKSILQEIETEIGSERMEVFSRIKKIVGFINVTNKLYKLKKLKEKYLISLE